MGDLYALPYSPWSEKARWALDHHGVAYREIQHVPMLGERRLRRAAKRRDGRVSVPLYVDADGIFDDSFTIGRHADAVGKAAPLFPPAEEAAIEAWNGKSEAILRAGRPKSLARMAGNPKVLRALLPSFVPGFLRGLMAPTAAMGVRHVMRKYAALAPADADGVITRTLGELEATLRGKDYILGSFTFADIAMAATLQFVSPVDDRYVPVGGVRAAWEDPKLAERFASLVAWRDALYAKHRRG